VMSHACPLQRVVPQVLLLALHSREVPGSDPEYLAQATRGVGGKSRERCWCVRTLCRVPEPLGPPPTEYNGPGAMNLMNRRYMNRRSYNAFIRWRGHPPARKRAYYYEQTDLSHATEVMYFCDESRSRT